MNETAQLHRNPRRAGVLLHPTSLPGTAGLGPEAYRFVDFLKDAGQTAWQILPVGPIGPGNSPYAARSAFAGDPMLLSLEEFRERGWLRDGEEPPFVPGVADRIDYAARSASREPLLRLAFERFLEEGGEARLEAFRAVTPWLAGYAAFAALRATYGAAWWEWPLEYRSAAALREQGLPQELAGEVRYHEFLQLAFTRQWGFLKAYANERGVQIIGDIPIFVDRDSADVWANPHLFKLDAATNPLVIAGVPPDAFSVTGQRWGNPVYDWAQARMSDYEWWATRLSRTFEMVDAVRLDHFRGFEAAWEIPDGEPTAANGAWSPGPGRDLFDSLEARFGRLPIIVEDLGIITPAVRALRDGLGYPGMAVLQFAFGDDWRNPYLPHNHLRELVAYTGTHDNDTTLGWFHALGEFERENVLRYLGRDGSDIVSDLVRLVYESVADIAIIPMQDVLQLGNEARMNRPGEPEGNWTWRFQWDQVHPARTAWLREMAERFGRTARGFAYENE
ncbi:MAG: 4-alpha-glucanotransferase [Tepidiformaceae bacterium]